MRSFFFRAEQRQADTVTLGSEESHHIVRVLRMPQGTKVTLYDHHGGTYLSEIVELKENVRLRIIAELHDAGPGHGQLFVGAAGVKVKNMEIMLQKCTELGVDAFYPFVSSRCQNNLIRQYHGKTERWRRIIEEACKQCLRPMVMELHDICTFGELIELPRRKNLLRFICWEQEEAVNFFSVAGELTEKNSVFLLCGPEGGFSGEEIDSAVRAGWRSIGLGKRVLRAETAVIAATAIVQHYLGHI